MNNNIVPLRESLDESIFKTSSGHQERDYRQQERSRLSLSMSRQIQVKRYPVIAELSLRRERPDIVSLLKMAIERSGVIPTRLKSYLETERLWDSQEGSLTKRGRETLKDGCLEQKERGLYHVWYSSDDPLIGTQPLFIQRDNAFSAPSNNTWKSGTDAQNSEFSVSTPCPVVILDTRYDGQKTTQALQNLKLMALKPEVICPSQASACLELKWQIGIDQSVVHLKGELETVSFSKREQSLWPIEIEINQSIEYLNQVMEPIAAEFAGEWDTYLRRVRVELNSIQHDPQAIQLLEVRKRSITKLKTNLGTFDTEAHSLPIKPMDLCDAERWQQAWLRDAYSKTYLSQADARLKQSRWLDHEAIADFDLSFKSGAALLECLGRESDTDAYWHVAAMEDLSPSQARHYRLPITLMNSTALNIRQLLVDLTRGEQVNFMIYSDRYVHTSRQSRNLKIIDRYTLAREGFLLTLAPPVGKSEATLPENWSRLTIEKHSDNHGRYWILIGTHHTWCWECSSGLDFIQLKDGEDDFIVEGTPTFTPKEETELPGYLIQALEKVRAGELP